MLYFDATYIFIGFLVGEFFLLIMWFAPGSKYPEWMDYYFLAGMAILAVIPLFVFLTGMENLMSVSCGSVPHNPCLK